MEKRIRRRVGVLVILGMLLFIGIAVPGTSDPTDSDWERDVANGEIYLGTSTDEVGIGTANPAASLHILDGTDYLLYSNSGNGCLSVWNPETTSNEVRLGAAWGDPGVYCDGPLYLYSNNGYGVHIGAADSVKMTVNNAGNVGIGTTSPGARLHLYGAGDELLRLDDTSSTGSPYLSFYQNTIRRSYIRYYDPGSDLRLVSEYGELSLWTGTSGSEAERVTVTSSGYVGIGTTSPSEMLDVNGDIQVRGADIRDSGGYSRISLPGSGDLDLCDDGGGTSLTVDSVNGYVGIWTTSPTSELEVNGAIEMNINSEFYFGDPNTEGSWRIRENSDDLIFERFNGADWLVELRIDG